MAFNRHMKWQGENIKFPTNVSWGFQDVASAESGRTLSAKMNKEVVAVKRTLSCSWSCMTDAEASDLLGKVKNRTYGALNYPDPFEGTNITKTFYTSDAKADMKTIEDNEFIWDVSFEFIEQ